MARLPPAHILLAAGPGAPGVLQLLERAQGPAAADRPLRVLLAGPGLAWSGAAHRAALPAGADIAVCSQDARAAGWSAAASPHGVRWSSVATWLAEIQAADEQLWTALP